MQTSLNSAESHWDVIVVGAGPVGLLLANYLGAWGVRTLVLERSEALIDYPRGVGMDDECLRAFQAVGLAGEVLQHTTPHQFLRFVTGKGHMLASLEPGNDEYGWPRRNAFIQPLADQVLLKGLARYDHVRVLFGHTLEGFEAHDDHMQLQVSHGETSQTLRAGWLLVAMADAARCASSWAYPLRDVPIPIAG